MVSYGIHLVPFVSWYLHWENTIIFYKSTIFHNFFHNEECYSIVNFVEFPSIYGEWLLNFYFSLSNLY